MNICTNSHVLRNVDARCVPDFYRRRITKDTKESVLTYLMAMKRVENGDTALPPTYYLVDMVLALVSQPLYRFTRVVEMEPAGRFVGV